jgi:hypothetical protein
MNVKSVAKIAYSNQKFDQMFPFIQQQVIVSLFTFLAHVV